MEQGCKNEDRLLWRAIEDDCLSPSIHVTSDGLIGINVGGNVKVMEVTAWHKLTEVNRAPMTKADLLSFQDYKQMIRGR